MTQIQVNTEYRDFGKEKSLENMLKRMDDSLDSSPDSDSDEFKVVGEDEGGATSPLMEVEQTGVNNLLS